MIRLVGLSLLALVALALCGYALARALVGWRAERRRVRAIRQAQREADARDSLRLSREQARERLAECESEARYEGQRQRDTEDAAWHALNPPPEPEAETASDSRTVTIQFDLTEWRRRCVEEGARVWPQGPDVDNLEYRPRAISGGYVCPESTHHQPRDASERAHLPPLASGTRTVSTVHWGTAEYRPHPLGWQTVGLTGGVLCAVKPTLCTCESKTWCSEHNADGSLSHAGAMLVERFDPPSCGWVRVLPDEPLHRQAVEAVGQ